MLLLCHLPAGPGGGEAAPSPVAVIKVVYVFACGGGKTDCTLCAWAMPCTMRQRGECGSGYLLASGQSMGNKSQKQKATQLLTYK